MWLIVSLLGALATSLVAIFSKIGIKDVNSNFATFFRTGLVIVFSLVLCLISGSIFSLPSLNLTNWIYLIVSGIFTGCSWLCYFKAISLGNINKVAPIDKSSFVLTSILFLIFFFDDTTNNGDILTIIMLVLSNLLMLIGTILMIDKKDVKAEKQSKKWLIYAILSSIFAAFVSLFIKLGLSGIQSDLGTLIRTIIVFIFAGTIVLFNKDYKGVKNINKKSWFYLILSSICTGLAWIFEYYSYSLDGVNPMAVNSISKLSILLTVLFSYIFLKEKFSKKSILGLTLLTSGIIIIIVFSF